MANELKDIEYHSRKGEKLENLIRYVNKETLKEQHRKQQINKASGVDKITKQQYGENLDNNIEDLHKRMKMLSYKPQPVRRTYIPKTNGKLRPLGIPAYEDKLVQGCMANVLEEIYECKFLSCSFGFRKGRNCHQAIREINQTIMTKKVSYILDCDIKGFFDNVNHEWLMKFLEHDIKDKVFLRYIKRFAKFSLEVAEDKTKIIPFGRFKGNKETFDFLGFMHYNATTRTGKYTVGHKISKKKKKSKNEAISKWLKDNRHLNIVLLINKLNKKLVGMYAYYGINGMLEELYKIYYHVKYMLWQVIKRRSQRSIKLDEFLAILEKFSIAEPKIYKDIWNWNV